MNRYLHAQRNYYTTLSAVQRTGADVAQYYQGLQIAPNLTNGAYDVVRDGLAIYRVIDPAAAAFGRASANPQFGASKIPQFFVPDTSTLERVGTIPFVNEIPGVKP